MIAKYAIAGLAGSALLATVAFAQSPSTSSDTTKASPPATMSDTSSSFHGNWRASKLVGLSVYNDKNESVGSINDMLTDKNGKIVAVVIGVGGFLGVGEHLVAIPFEKVKFSTEPVVYSGAANAPAGGAGGAGGARPGGSSTTTGAATTAPAAKPNPWWPDHAIFNATKDELKAMPEFKYST
jgi:sporulation protein YlmC with PRC-barrel domain